MISLLLVDAELYPLELGKRSLQKSVDNSIKTVYSALDALNLLKNGHFDAIVSYYQMPAMIVVPVESWRVTEAGRRDQG